MKITNIKKSVGEYKRANAGGVYSPRYANIMLNRENGRVWIDEYYSIGHGSYTVYADPAIINLGAVITDNGALVNMVTIRAYAEKLCAEYAA